MRRLSLSIGARISMAEAAPAVCRGVAALAILLDLLIHIGSGEPVFAQPQLQYFFHAKARSEPHVPIR